MAVCNHCERDGGEGRYCEYCGKPLARGAACPKCGHEMESKTRFCPECGFSLPAEGASVTVTQLPDGLSAAVASRPKPPQLADGGRGVQDARKIADLLANALQSIR
jgi:hypothetical protein